MTKYFGDALNIVTGNLDRPGCTVFGHSMIDNEKLGAMTGQNGYDRWRTRVDGLPEVFGTSPVATMAREIRTPGKGQLRALFVCAGNMVTSAPAGDEVEAALGQLDLLVSLDPYVTETSRLAHYILPPTLWLERDGMPMFTFGNSLVPYGQWIPATVTPLGEARDDGWILDQVCKRSVSNATEMCRAGMCDELTARSANSSGSPHRQAPSRNAHKQQCRL